jgi:hypothetical protein
VASATRRTRGYNPRRRILRLSSGEFIRSGAGRAGTLRALVSLHGRMNPRPEQRQAPQTARGCGRRPGAPHGEGCHSEGSARATPCRARTPRATEEPARPGSWAAVHSMSSPRPPPAELRATSCAVRILYFPPSSAPTLVILRLPRMSRPENVHVSPARAARRQVGQAEDVQRDRPTFPIWNAPRHLPCRAKDGASGDPDQEKPA